MHQRKRIKKITSNNKEFKASLYYGEICPICKPNRGCNRRSKGHDRNWKRFRKTQWKNKENIMNYDECDICPNAKVLSSDWCNCIKLKRQDRGMSCIITSNTYYLPTMEDYKKCKYGLNSK